MSFDTSLTFTLYTSFLHFSRSTSQNVYIRFLTFPVVRLQKAYFSIASLLGFAVCMNPAIAKDTSEHLTAQQNKMSYCSKEAAAKDLHGDKRKEFMKECLSKKVDDGKKKLTKQQEKMVKCSKEAKEKALKGELRKKFMSDCLKN